MPSLFPKITFIFEFKSRYFLLGIQDHNLSVFFEHSVWKILYNNERDVLLVVEKTNGTRAYQVWMIKNGSKTTMWGVSDVETVVYASDGDYLYAKKYQNQHDPSSYLHLRYHLETGKSEEMRQAFAAEPHCEISEPVVYPPETDHHQTIGSFLGLQLPLPCEYLETTDHIIISYYLRCEKGFDRFLLVIKEEKKSHKIHQDHDMQGFASGAFFLLKGQLVFVKNRNEICFYTL